MGLFVKTRPFHKPQLSNIQTPVVSQSPNHPSPPLLSMSTIHLAPPPTSPPTLTLSSLLHRQDGQRAALEAQRIELEARFKAELKRLETPPDSEEHEGTQSVTRGVSQGGTQALDPEGEQESRPNVSRQKIRPTTTYQYLAQATKQSPSHPSTAGAEMDDCDNENDGDYAQVATMNSGLRLNATGDFEEIPIQPQTSLSNTNNASFRLEDSVMDKRRSISFRQVSGAEKRAVFQLGAVRRNMRHVEHAQMLLSEEALKLSNKFMEMGPSRASLLSIGHVAIQGEANSSYDAERYWVSWGLGVIGDLRGYHPVGWVVATASQLGQVSFYAMHIYLHGANIISCSSLLLAFFQLAVMPFNTFETAFLKKNLTMAKDTPEDDLWMSASCYARLRGMEVFGAGQRKLAAEKGHDLDPDSDMSTYGPALVKTVLRETIFVHFLLMFGPMSASSIITAVRMYNRGQHLMAALAVCSFWSLGVSALILAEIGFNVRLCQRLNELEIRRTEADIRTIAPNLVHRVTPRFKALLHECHGISNTTHFPLANLIPFLLVSFVQMVTGLFVASTGGSDACIPTWTFAAFFSPAITLLVIIHGFGELNLAIERDVDQDIVEMNIRLTFSENHVPNWLLQQLICLERLDGRAHSLPMNLVPSVEMSRSLGSSLITACTFLMPLLMSVTDKLSSELLCSEDTR